VCGLIGGCRQWAPSGSEVSLIGQTVIEQDGELMRFNGMERRRLICGPPA
jgi:hypothetical protein